jgi:hypothetical protein
MQTITVTGFKSSKENPFGKKIKADGTKEQYGFPTTIAMTVKRPLSGLMGVLSPDRFITAGVFDVPECFVTPKGKTQGPEGSTLPVRHRTKDMMQYPAGPGLLVIDNDFATHQGETAAALTEAAPSIADAQYITKGSSGSYITAADGTELRGCKGEHVWIAVADASDIPRAAKVLHQRLIINGHDKSYVGGAGQILERSPVDQAVASPWQPVFLAAHLDEGLSQDLHAEYHDGEVLDTKVAIPDLSEDEIAEYNQITEDRKARLRNDCNRKKRECVAERVAEGWTEAAARSAIKGGVLTSDAIIKLADGTKVSIAEVIEHPEKYNNKTCYDPLEPGYRGGAVVGKIYTKDGKIFSQAHGGKVYRYYNRMTLEQQVERRQQQRDENLRLGTGEAFDAKAEVLTSTDMLKRFCYVASSDQVIDRNIPHIVKPAFNFNKTYATSVYLDVNGDLKREVDDWFYNPAKMQVEEITWRPGYPEVTPNPRGVVSYNTFCERKLPAFTYNEFAVEMFVEHVRCLFKDRTDDFLDWLAHIEQKPGVLPHQAWLHVASSKGRGRNWLAGVAARLWCGEVAASFDLSSQFESPFNDALSHCRLVVVDELREGGTDSYKHAQKLKSMITASVREINPKYGRKSIEYNCARWLMFSNFRSAIPLEEGDRRFEVVIDDDLPLAPEYYTALYGLLEYDDFIHSVRKFLIDRDISKYNPGAPAKQTEAKMQAMSSGRSEVMNAVQELLAGVTGDLISAEHIRVALNYSTDQMAAHARSVKMAMEEFGFTRLRVVKLAEYGRRVVVYVRGSVFAKWNKATAAEIGAALPPTQAVGFDD